MAAFRPVGVPEAFVVICHGLPGNTHQRMTLTPFAFAWAKAASSVALALAELAPPFEPQPKSQPQLFHGRFAPFRYQLLPCQVIRDPAVVFEGAGVAVLEGAWVAVAGAVWVGTAVGGAVVGVTVGALVGAEVGVDVAAVVGVEVGWLPPTTPDWAKIEKSWAKNGPLNVASPRTRTEVVPAGMGTK